MRILSLDLALANIGWTVWEGNGMSSFGTFENPKVTDNTMPDLAFRAKRAFEFIDAILDRNYVDIIVIERPHGSQNTKAAACMGVCAAICAYINILGYTIKYIEPMEMKKWLKSFPIFPPVKDPKLLARKVVKRLGYIAPEYSEHEIDSICIYYCYLSKNETNT